MSNNEIARFTVRVLAADHATWQGLIETESESYYFKSEMQLIKWLCERFPELYLHPDG